VTNPIEELGERVTALEHKVHEVQATADSARADAAAARVLAGGADRDVSAFGAKLDVHKALLEALRETQVEQGQRLTGVEGRLSGVEGRLTGVEGRLTSLEGKVDKGFSMLATGQAQITALLRNIEAQGGQPDQS
jgi:hypothetical protein